jgi:hypothetical protein
MSFLQHSGATASVVADSDVEASIVDAEEIEAQLATLPGLATRFYQSLALMLSERLEELTTALLPRDARVDPYQRPVVPFFSAAH